MENNVYNRTSIVLGLENVEKLKNSNVLLCGIGGVGSYTLEALARVGIGNITIVDKDIIDETNINRQLIALNSTVGMDKVEVAKKRCLDINPEMKIQALKIDINSQNILEIFLRDKFDYVVDCVDNIEAKINIIKVSNDKKIKCISSMGTANKINPLNFEVTDIYKTKVCPLAKVMRKKLKEIGIKKQKVVYSTENPVKNSENSILGSVSFVPSVCGLIIASEVVKDIIKD